MNINNFKVTDNTKFRIEQIDTYEYRLLFKWFIFWFYVGNEKFNYVTFHSFGECKRHIKSIVNSPKKNIVVLWEGSLKSSEQDKLDTINYTLEQFRKQKI